MLEQNEDFTSFWSAAIGVSEQYHASVEGEDARFFIETLYGKY